MRWPFLALAVLAFAAVACGGGDDEGESAFVEMLRLIPDTPEARVEVFINDYARLREITGVEPPGERDVEAVRRYVQELFRLDGPDAIGGSSAFISGGLLSGLGLIGPEVITEEGIGFSFADIDLDIQAGIANVGRARGGEPRGIYYSAARGSLDPGVSARAAEASFEREFGDCGGCPTFEAAEHLGVRYFTWGLDDDIDLLLRFSPPAFDHLGRSGRLAFLDQLVLHTHATEPMRQMIAASKGTSSLAEDEYFRMAAIALGRERVYRAFLSEGGPSMQTICGDDEECLAGDWLPDGVSLLKRYEALGIGWVLEGFERSYVVVLAHDSSEIAHENAERLRQLLPAPDPNPLARRDDLLETFDISVEGRLVVAELTGYSPYTSVLIGDYLFWYDED